jgi:hypothetical protein
MVRLAGFEPATFGSGDRRSNPTELQAHVLILQDLAEKANGQNGPILAFHLTSI